MKRADNNWRDRPRKQTDVLGMIIIVACLLQRDLM